ncbi:MAG: ABC transporter permease [Pseudoxanthomonas suwonensis]|nr:ABC transporter permease [Pseudoxanthomonas suwonensis]
MLGYYFHLALRSLKRNRGLTVVMVLAIALGIGATMTTLTVYHVLSGDPLPQKSDRIFYPQIDPRAAGGVKPGDDPPDQWTRYDAEQLIHQARGKHQAVMSAGNVIAKLEGSGARPMMLSARYTSADFFPMFDVPVAEGEVWQRGADDARARVAVISRELRERLFGSQPAVGRSIQLNGNSFRVLGVLGAFEPIPRFYDMTTDRYSNVEEVFLPYSTSRQLNFDTQGGMNCWGRPPKSDEGPRALNAPCAWLQYWVELDSSADADAYRTYLENYSRQQHAAGRFELAPNVRLHNLMGWLDYRKVVPGDVKLQMWLAFGFLLVCLLNTIGLMLAKFLRRGGEYGVRRALGASRRAIFLQCVTEAGVVGIVGGALGLLLAWLGLWVVRQQPDDYAQLARMDPNMLVATFALAIGASMLAGWLPAWRAARIAPAIQLKSQ